MSGSPEGAQSLRAAPGVSAEALLDSAYRKNTWRLVVILVIAYVVNYLDRNSIAFAGLTMNMALGLTARQFGLAAGLSVASYSLLEVPSNLFMQRVGARLWLSRIMITWGIAAGAGALVIGPYSLSLSRLVLGAAEAGFFPGVLMYLSTWFPSRYRTRVFAWFLLGIPLSSVVGGPAAGLLLGMNGYLHLAGWQWIYIAEGAPAIVLGVLTYVLLVDDPREAKWLTPDERHALLDALANERRSGVHHDFSAAMKDARVLILTVIQFGFTLGTYGIGIWLPLILKQHHLTNLRIGLLSVPPYLAACIAMLLWARSADRNEKQIFHLTLSCALAAAGLIGSALSPALVPRLAGLTIALIGATSARAIFWAIPPRFLVGTAAAGGLAFINSVGTLGGFFGPFLMGWLKDLTGSFDSGLALMGLIILISAAFSAVLPTFERDG
ncbi:MAG: MFS transporter [Gammaproteobacteria bacterium]|nr:MFS transporter [Gammaproteobacteria bacterium]MDE2262794.1 MFS transporter [Gammaproteobacteria bacterium]